MTASAQLPKYLQIANEIIGRIRDGELAVGDRAPSENEIIAAYGVSNTTARKALTEIEHGGYVNRVKARGTYVSDTRVGRSADRILGFSRNMLEAGRNPSTHVLSVRLEQGGQSSQINGRRYQMAGPVCVLERLRLADGVPMMRERRFISLQLCPDIQDKDLTGSLYRIYEEDYGLQLDEVQQRLSAVMLETREELGLFRLRAQTPAFLVEGATFCGKELVLETERSVYRGDLYQFTVKAKR